MDNINEKRIRNIKVAIIFIVAILVTMVSVTKCTKNDKQSVSGDVTNTPAPELTNTPASTNTPIPSPTVSPTPVPTDTPIPSPTNTPTPSPTNTPTPSPTNTPVPVATSTPVPVATNTPIPTKQELSYYDEAFNGDCFIGDSRTEGIFLYSGITTADFLCDVGLNLFSVMGSDEVINGLTNNSYRNIYIQFGVNELGWENPDSFETKYVEFINYIKQLQPNATIYVESVIPVTQHKSDTSDCFTLENVKLYNERAIKVAESTSTVYIDVTEGICGPSRILPSEASSDGVHMSVSYTFLCLDTIIKNR